MTSNIPPANGSSELLSKDHDREAFRQCLRRADKLILENKFDEARAHLVEAAKLNPTQPMIEPWYSLLASLLKALNNGQSPFLETDTFCLI